MFVKYGYIFLCSWCAECSWYFSHFSSDESHMAKLVQHKYLILPKDISSIRPTVGTFVTITALLLWSLYCILQCLICLLSRLCRNHCAYVVQKNITCIMQDGVSTYVKAEYTTKCIWGQKCPVVMYVFQKKGVNFHLKSLSQQLEVLKSTCDWTFIKL